MKPVFFLKSNNKILQDVFNYFEDNPYPDDTEVHKFAEDNNIEPDKLEEAIYSILSTFISSGLSRKKDITQDNVDSKQLAMGIKVELEHVNPKAPCAKIIAKKIALDHLAEMGDYYTKLKRMENE